MKRSTISFAAIFLASLLSSCDNSQSAAQGPPLVKPTLRITAPPLQFLSLAAKHYEIDKDTTRSETLAKQFALTADDGGSIDVVLEDGFDGIAIELITTTDEPITLELFLDGKLHKTVRSSSVGRLRMAVGKTAGDEDLAVEVRLDSEETKLVQKILDAMVSRDGGLDELLSTDEKLLQVDGRLLREMMRIAAQRFGGGIKDVHAERWSKLLADDNGTWNYRLPVEFTDGTIFYIDLIVNSQKLVAVRLKHEEFDKDWWQQAAYEEVYVNLSKQVITFMIEKKYAETYALFGPYMKEKINMEGMKNYRDQFTQLPETGIQEITLLAHRETLVNDQFSRGAQQQFLVSFAGDVPDLKATFNYEFATGVTWKTAEITGFIFEVQKQQ